MRNKLIIQFFICTGARVSEVAGVRRKDIEKEYCENKRQGQFHWSYTKRQKTRNFFLQKRLYMNLKKFKDQRHLDDMTPLF